MPGATALVHFSPQVREAFDEACRVIFKIRSQRVSVGEAPHVFFLPGFAAHYRYLKALPRRMRRAHQRRWQCALSVIALSMTLGQGPAWAATLQVAPGTSPAINSDGKCSLIEAIVNANRDARTHLDCVAGAGTDTIILPEQSQQALKARENLPNIWTKIVIEGRGSTIRRNATDEFTSMWLNFFNITAAGDLTLNETTISGATASGFTGGNNGINNAGGTVRLLNSAIVKTGGSGLVNTGYATLDDSTIAENGWRGTYPSSDSDGGIANSNGGILILRNTTVTGNGAGFSGGGISNNGATSTATLTDSVVSGNTITWEGCGGGIYNSGTLSLVRSTVSGNYAECSGGIHNSGTATLARSTISSNAAGYNWGGGINNWGVLTVTNSTISNNFAYEGGAGLNLQTSASKVSIVSSTVTGNVVSTRTWYGYEAGGGLAVWAGTLTLQRSIVSGNTATTGPEISNQRDWSSGTVVADDYNIIGHDGDAGVVDVNLGSTDIVPNKAVAGILLPLADNGGGTKTHALAIGSPALNASPDDAGCRAIDQRGNPRPRGAACDIGAFEGSAVLCNNRVTTMVGTVNADEMTGTPGADIISGLTGNDVISGLDGNDVICAGVGADRTYGGIGNDSIFGEAGNDRLFGQGGGDKLNGGPDQDYCDGGGNSTTGDTAVACESVINVP